MSDYVFAALIKVRAESSDIARSMLSRHLGAINSKDIDVAEEFAVSIWAATPDDPGVGIEFTIGG